MIRHLICSLAALLLLTGIPAVAQDAAVYEIVLKNRTKLKGFIKEDKGGKYTVQVSSWILSLPYEADKYSYDEGRKLVTVNGEIPAGYEAFIYQNDGVDGFWSDKAPDKRLGRLNIASPKNVNRELEINASDVSEYNYPARPDEQTNGLNDVIYTSAGGKYRGQIVKVVARNRYVIKSDFDGSEISVPTKDIIRLAKEKRDKNASWLSQSPVVDCIDSKSGYLEEVLVIDKDFVSGQMKIVDKDDFTTEIPMSDVNSIMHFKNPDFYADLNEETAPEIDTPVATAIQTGTPDISRTTPEEQVQKKAIEIPAGCALVNGRSFPILQYTYTDANRIYKISSDTEDYKVPMGEVTICYRANNADDYELVELAGVLFNNKKREFEVNRSHMNNNVVKPYDVKDCGNGIYEKTYRINDNEFFVFRSLANDDCVLLKTT